MTFIPLSPIPIKHRISMTLLKYGQLDVIDGAFVLIYKNEVRTDIPTDPARFNVALSSGMGKSKAFGCGLMLIRRI